MKKISKSELVVMEILWGANTSMNRHEIAECCHKVNNESWELATISTFITRLYNKGMITYEKKNKINSYYPTITKVQYKQSIINQELNDVFGKNFNELLLTYINKEINEDNSHKVDLLLKELIDKEL